MEQYLQEPIRNSRSSLLPFQNGLGLDVDVQNQDNISKDSPSSESDNMRITQYIDFPLQMNRPPRPPRHDKKMMHIDSTDPGLDSALKFVSRGPLADLARERASVNPMTARRRGRAIYLNDLLQFNAKEQASEFYTTLLQWRNDQGECGDMGEEEEEEEEHDMIVLLAQARSLAQSSSYSFNSLANSSPWQSGPKGHFNKTSHRRSKKNMANLETSASTPEGALGKVALPEINFRPLNWDGSEMEEMISSSDGEDEIEDAESSSKQDQADEIRVLRAGLRFTIGCYDDLFKKSKSDALSSAVRHCEHRKSSTDEIPLAVPVRTRSRSRSLIKALTIKGASLTSDRSSRHSLASSVGHESVLDLDTSGLDQIAGPSSRYGMANVSVVTSPSLEEKNPLEKTSSPLFKTKSIRRSSDTTSASSPTWSRRPSKLETPSEQDEGRVEEMSVSHSSLASALQQMRRMDRGKLQSQMSKEQSLTQFEEMIQLEKVKNAALTRQLETLKASFSNLEKKSNETSGLSDIELGARTDEEAMMMEAVAQAARDTVQAEEREAEWKVECEVITERVNILEEALFQAMGLLAGEEQKEKIPTQSNFQQNDNDEIEKAPRLSTGHLEIVSPKTLPSLTFASSPTKEMDGRLSGTSSPFYSAGEDDDEMDELTPFASLSKASASTFDASLQRYTKTGSDVEPFSSNNMKQQSVVQKNIARKVRADSENDFTVKVSGWDQSDTPVLSDGEKEESESKPADSVLCSPGFSAPDAAESRRESHASLVRHSIPPPNYPLPMPLPPVSAKEDKTTNRTIPVITMTENLSNQTDEASAMNGEVSNQIDSKLAAISEKNIPSTTTNVIDYSSRAKAKRNDTSKVDTEEEKITPTVSLYSNIRSAIADEKKTRPPFSTEVDYPATNVTHDRINSSEIKSESSWSPGPSITRRKSITPSIGTASSISSRGTEGKTNRNKTAGSKSSILGHMPSNRSSQNQSISSSASIRSSDTQPSSVSNGISEHYEKLSADRSGANKSPGKAAFFARRTRFAAS